MNWFRLGFALFFLLGMSAPVTQAGLLDFNYINPNDLGSLVPQSVTNEAIKMFALYACHRPYSGATAITKTNTLDLNIEATLVKLGDGLITALNSNGIKTSNTVLPGVPFASLNLRKGFNDSFDVGISILTYKGQSIFGGDLKFVLYDEEEGPSIAMRLGYTYINLPYAYVVHTSVFNPEFVMSRRLSFAEPYLGVGFRYFTGALSVPVAAVNSPIPNTPPLIPSFTISASGSGTDEYAFTGVYFRILGSQGLRLGIEGSFDVSGYHTIGGVFGIGF